MNDPTANGSNDKKFALKLFYDTDMTGTLTGNAQYNGNINGMMWRRTDNTKKGYNFSYDGLNRLTAADYGTYNGNWAASNANDMGITSYDMNGNINGLTRKDHQGNTLDNFGYTLTGNRLASVSGTLSGSYNYDSNGNLTYDGPRSLTVSYFDELNLPKQYFRNDTSKVDYCYDAQAVKWSKTATRNGTPTTTLYYGPFIYLSGSLSIVLTQEGYYDPASSLYHYYLKDHLGNTRITFHYSGTTPVIDQEVEYYPFGALFTDNTMGNNKYLYNGKELNNEFFENYDYGARFYDPELGRWHVVDPVMEFTSPYVGIGNNPVNLIDPYGMAVTATENGYTITGDDIFTYWNNLQYASQQENWNNFYEALDFASVNPQGNAFANAIDGINVTPFGSNLNYDREWGGEYNLSFRSETEKSNPIVDAIYKGQRNFLGYPITRATISGLTFIASGGIEGIMSLPSLARSGWNLFSSSAAKGVTQYSDDLVKAAQKIYPKKAGTTQLHHITPKYLGGAKNGSLVPLDGAYHQMITNEFRALWGYGKGVPSATELQSIMKQVYTKYPLPPGYGF